MVFKPFRPPLMRKPNPSHSVGSIGNDDPSHPSKRRRINNDKSDMGKDENTFGIIPEAQVNVVGDPSRP
jgi:hypothetical protein